MAFKFYALILSAICIVVFVLQLIFPIFTEIFLLNNLSFAEPWRFVSAIFLHGGMAHLIYNLFALALFGSILESLIGNRKFLVVFFATGVLANIVSVNFYDSSLGASGAIFGVIGALIVVRPSMMVWAFGLPMPMFIAGILWAAGDLIGVFVPSNVANIAHLSGMFAGLIFGAFYRTWKYERKSVNSDYVDENLIRGWEDRNMR